jgi:hypothetical protein
LFNIVGEKTIIMELAGYITCIGEFRNAHKILNGKFQGKRPAC